MALFRDSNKIFLIELKGKDISHAVRQIVNTSKLLKDELAGREVTPVMLQPSVPLRP